VFIFIMFFCSKYFFLAVVIIWFYVAYFHPLYKHIRPF
jgi:hypothetical protein